MNKISVIITQFPNTIFHTDMYFWVSIHMQSFWQKSHKNQSTSQLYNVDDYNYHKKYVTLICYL